MATLFNTKISNTYQGLLKTVDNAAISATLRELSDGSGNQTGLYLNTAGDFKVTSVLEWGSLKDTGTGVTITRYVTSTDGLENFDNNTSLPTSAAVKLYVDTKFATSDTLQEVLSFGNTTSGSDIVVSLNDNITFTDSSKALFGNSQDLEINHNGTDSFVTDLGTGDLRLRSDNSIKIQASTGGNNLATFTKGAGVDLYFNNAKKLETTNTGVSVTGIISNLTNPNAAQDAATKSYVDALDAGSDLDITDGTTTGDVNLNTQTLSILGTTNEIETVVSGQGVTIGLPSSISTDLVGNVTGNLTGNVAGDLTGNVTSTSVLANGVTATTQASTDSSTKVATTAYVKGLDNASDLDFSGDSGTGDVNLNAQTFAITGTANQIESSASNQGLSLQFPTAGVTLPNGSVATTQSADDNSTKVATTSYVDTSAALYLPLAGGTMSGNTIHNDSIKSIYGTGSDAQVYHDGSNFYANNSTGQLNIDQSAVTESIVFKTSDANALDTTALIINRGGDLITGRDVTIAGDLTVNGTTTTVNSQTLSVDDPLISLAINNAANSLDIGYYGKYNDGTTRYLGLYNDASDSNKFKLFKGTTVEPTTTVNIGAAGYAAADLQVAGLEATNFVSTDITIADFIYHAGDLDTKFGFDANNSYSINLGGDNVLDFYQTVLYLKKPTEISTSLSVGTTGTFGGNVTTDGYLTLAGQATPQIFMASNTAGITPWTFIARNDGYFLLGRSGVSNDFYFDPSGNATFSGNVAINGNATLGDGTADNHIINGQVTQLTADALGYKLQRSNGATSMLISSTSDAEIEFGIDNGSGTNTTQWTIGKDGTDNSFRISNSASLGTSDTLTLTGANSTFAGNVNIGSSLSWEKLEVGGAIRIRVANTSSASLLLNNTDTQLSIENTGGNMIFTTAGAVERIRIDSAGNVGIGTASPIGKLDVSDGTNPLSFDSSTYNEIQSYNRPLLINRQGNNVGIGTDNPAQLLDVNGIADINSIVIGKNGDSIYHSNSDFYIKTETAHALIFRTSNTNRLTIEAGGDAIFTGNVGIGTASPDTNLDVQSATGTLRLGNNIGSVGIGAVVGKIEFSNVDTSIGSGVQAYIQSRAIDSGATYAMDFFTGTKDNPTQTGLSLYNGNVGIGTTSPNHLLDLSLNDDTTTTLYPLNIKRNYATSSATDRGIGILFSDLNSQQATITSFREDSTANYKGYLTFSTNNGVNGTDIQEKMRITSGGVVGIGEANPTQGSRLVIAAPSGTANIMILKTGSTTNANVGAIVFQNSGGSQVGQITVNGATGVTSYITSSDYRLKEDLQDFTGLDMVSKIPVYDYKWKSAESRSYGVMAHELQEVLPDAVSGEKDAEEMQGVDYSKIVPLLIKSIQELTAKVERLEAK